VIGLQVSSIDACNKKPDLSLQETVKLRKEEGNTNICTSITLEGEKEKNRVRCRIGPKS
jgi:hypothetical protein